jgi:nucleoside-diphosphate-sugar epimerase
MSKGHVIIDIRKNNATEPERGSRKIHGPQAAPGSCFSSAEVNRPRLPKVIETEAQLDEVLTRPGALLVKFIKSVPSPLLILGAGGKMGPTLAVLARRAAARHPLDVIAVSRFRDPAARAWLEARGVKTVSCDLLEAEAVRRLPDAEAIVYLVGLKFGTAQDPPTTWAMNTVVPLRALERYPHARIVALSTGNVYPMTQVGGGGGEGGVPRAKPPKGGTPSGIGSLETAPLTPLGEYANAAVGRERIFEFCARRQQTPVALLRLFYAVELRYGVLVDLAQRVHLGQPIELANGYFNCIWQGDANELILRSLALAASPPSVWNLCRPETFSVRAVARRLGELLGRPARFVGTEAPTALLGNSARICAALGAPATPLETMLHWIVHWVKLGGRNLGKPTHFEVRDGRY